MTPEQLKQIYFSFYETHELGNRMKELYDSKKTKDISTDLKESLVDGFWWSETEEGMEYWYNLYKSLK